MFKNIVKLFLILSVSINLYAQSGFSQEHLVSVSPDNLATFVTNDTSIEIEFDLNIDENSIKKNTIVLKREIESTKNVKVDGTTTMKNATTLIFIPDEPLLNAKYNVKVKKIRLQDFSNENKTKFQKYAQKICSYFYDDVKKCFLYRYACSIKTKEIKYSFSVEDIQVQVVSLTLNKSNIQLNENNETDINVTARYDDNSTQDVTQDVEWIMSNNSIISIVNNKITPLGEGTTTLQAKYNKQTSTQIQITVYKEINGYKLPPEPDPTINNSTLLGIDSNDNGVRDDVEIYVIKRFAQDLEFPKTKTAIAMQYAWASQKILENPFIETKQIMSNAIGCKFYWIRQKSKTLTVFEAVQFGVKHRIYDSKVKDIIFNTRVRIERKFEYNNALSGQIFQGKEKTIDMCQININEIGE